jgi:drug/metabolite transporter (DMT)-like permease
MVAVKSLSISAPGLKPMPGGVPVGHPDRDDPRHSGTYITRPVKNHPLVAHAYSEPQATRLEEISGDRARNYLPSTPHRGQPSRYAPLEMPDSTTATSPAIAPRSRSAGLAASVLAAIGWGFGGVFATLTFAPGLVLTFYRVWLGTCLLLVVLYASGRRLNWPMLRATWLGGVLLAGDMSMFFSAVKLTSVVDATVIGAAQPVLVIIVARPLFGERIGRWDLCWIALALGGVVAAVVGPGVTSHHEVVGDLLAVGAMLSWSAYWLASKHARAVSDAVEYTVGVTLVAAVVMVPIVLLSGQSLARVKAGDWLWISLLAIVPGSAHLIMNWAHRYVDASISSVIGSSNPIVAAVAALVILGQPLTAVQVSGGLVGLVAIAVVATRHRQPAETPAAEALAPSD